MGFRFTDWLFGVGEKRDSPTTQEVDMRNRQIFCDALQEYMIRELAFHTCVNMIANAMGKCEFKTYRNHEEFKGREYFLWNIEPNPNQNSSAFLHKLIYQLYRHNEALAISLKTKEGLDILAVADSFASSSEYPKRLQEYTDVVVGEVSFKKTFTERDVLHLSLNHRNIKPILDGLHSSYDKLISAATKNYMWASGKHLKVHVDQIAQQGTVGANGQQKDWTEMFAEKMEFQVKPFLEAANGVLPEFDGYKYEEVGGSPDANRSTRDIRALMDDIFDFTARGFCIPPVLLLGDVAGTKDAMSRWLTTCIDPLRDQIEEEINRKRYGFAEWEKGNYISIDTSNIIHFDMFDNASNIEKLIGSGVYSINDVLRATSRAEIPEDWADKHFMTLNIGDIEKVSKTLGGESK